MKLSVGREFGRVLVGVLPFLAHFGVFRGEFLPSFLPFGRVLGEFLHFQFLVSHTCYA